MKRPFSVSLACVRVLCCLFFALFAAMPAVGQQVVLASSIRPDQTKLLGITYDLFRQSYPHDCNKLQAVKYADGTTNPFLQSCVVRHHAKELVSGSKIWKEVAFFEDHKLTKLDFQLLGSGASLGLIEAYGNPDPPVKMDSSYAFGEATYGGEGSSMTLDGRGESHFNFYGWTRPGFLIRWTSSSYESWDDMAERDNSVFGGLSIGPLAVEKVTFTFVPVLSAASQPQVLPEATKQAIVTNSEAAKSSPAAAAELATTGHMPTAEELAAEVQAGEASRCAVITDPPGAEIDVDGNKAGVSPMAFVLLKHGDTPRVITIKMSGFKTVEMRVVPDGKTIPIGLTLEKEPQ